MTNEELVRAVLEKVGGKDNVVTATNCMTRLRLEVREDAKIDEAGLNYTQIAYLLRKIYPGADYSEYGWHRWEVSE